MRVAVIGAGAIGGFIAAALARSGIPVAVVARGKHLEAIREEGLRVEGDLGSFTARVDAADDIRKLGRVDVLLLTFKAHQWPGFLDQLAPYAGSDVPIVTLQNGVPFWFARTPPLRTVDPEGRIGNLFSDSQTIGGVVHVSGHVAEPGKIVQSGGLRYLLAEASGRNGERVEGLVQTLRAAQLEAVVDDDLRRSLWYKLVGNASLNPVSAVTGLTISQMLNDSKIAARIRALMIEALRVGRALGVAGDDVESAAEARMAYAARLDDVKTSMLQDLEAERPLEIEPILGATIELAERCSVDVPQLRAVDSELRPVARNT